MTGELRRQLWETFKRDRLAIGLSVVLGLIVIGVIGAPWLARHDPVAVNYSINLKPPSGEYWLGTDQFGRDIFARMLYGGQASLSSALVAVVLIISLSLLIGLSAGYYGGWVDTILSRLIDVLLSFPRLVLAIAIAALLGPGVLSLMIAIAAVSWPAYARIFRSYVLQIKHEGYVLAARCSGTPGWKIMLTHVLGSLIGPLLVLITVDIGQIILSIASLSFLGLGVCPPDPEWGAMLNEGRAYLEEAPWLFLAPGVTIFIVVFGANYIGDTIRDALEPRSLNLPPIRGLFRPQNKDHNNTGNAREQNVHSNAPEVAIAVHNLSVSVMKDGLPVHPILKSIDLKVHVGECIGVVGESGSGKSTLALTMLGLLKDPLKENEGNLTFLGQNTKNWTWDDWRLVRGRRIALINQDPLNALNPVLRIGSQIEECLRYGPKGSTILNSKARHQKVCGILEKVGLPPDVYRQYPHQLSGGMRQRVVIAMAIINEPQILIADEPTTALDVSTQARILELLSALQRKSGAALIFISHDLRLVAQVADRVVVMREGRIVEEGLVNSIFNAPNHDYTRQLLAAIPQLSIPAHFREKLSKA